MRKQILTLLGAGLIGLMHPAAAQATLLDFTFSFTGTAPPGSVAGTVTGEIFGLTAGITSSATNVIVESYPAGLEPPAPPITVFTNIVINTFSVNSMGTITDAQYLAFDTTGSVSLELNAGDITNALTTSDDTEPPRDIINVSGFPGVTYTPAPIPEPSSVTILGTGLGLAALWLLRQGRRRRWATA
jgi:hypothetical protein